MAGQPRRTLLEIALLACEETGPAERHALVPTDPVALGLHGPEAAARAAQANGGLVRTARDTAAVGKDKYLPDGGTAEARWMIDGWSLGACTWEVDFGNAFIDRVQLDRADTLNTKVS